MITWDVLFRNTRDIREGIAMALAVRQIVDREVHYPANSKLYTAFDFAGPRDTKVVILGIEPYHNDDNNDGLAFSSETVNDYPRTLKNIFKELKSDIGSEIPNHGSLRSWAKQGVFLLNLRLSVTKGQSTSHDGLGWEDFTDEAIKILSAEKNKVFILWGQAAASKLSLIDQENNHIINAPHPSPLSVSRGFYGSKPFSKANEYLVSKNLTPINWEIKNV